MVQGPNVKKMIAHQMSIMAIPPNGGFAGGVAFLTDVKRIVETCREATEVVEEMIEAVKSATDNPYHTDEEIAGEILRQLKEQESKRGTVSRT